VKSWEPAYSQALNLNKILQEGQDPENQADSQTAMVDDVETGRVVWGRG